jgi:hypothetical protein
LCPKGTSGCVLFGLGLENGFVWYFRFLGRQGGDVGTIGVEFFFRDGVLEAPHVVYPSDLRYSTRSGLSLRCGGVK